MRAAICDDDPTLSTVVARLATSLGYEVVAQVAAVHEAVDLCTYGDVDLLVLDVALEGGNALDVLRRIEGPRRPMVVVFSAFVNERATLVAAGAAEVIEKPDFERLEAFLAQAAALAEGDDRGDEPERRRRVPVVALPPPAGMSPLGVEPPESFAAALTAAPPGSIVMAVSLDQSSPDRAVWDRFLAAEQRVELARTVRGALRGYDRLTVDGDSAFLVLLLEAPAGAVDRIFGRVSDRWGRLDRKAAVVAGWTVVDETGVAWDHLDRARRALGNALRGGMGSLVRA